MAVEKEYASTNEISLVTPTKGIYICSLEAARKAQGFDGIISCIENTIPNQNAEANPAIHGKRLDLQCGSGKLGSRALRNQLDRIPPFINTLTPHTHVPRILFACSSGRDLAVGAALVVICLFFNDNCK
jgi:tRNA A64-2'-O-ribosylphosphate transferase